MPSSTVDFAIADPNTFVAGAAAFIDLGGGGGSTTLYLGHAVFLRPQDLYRDRPARRPVSTPGPYYAY